MKHNSPLLYVLRTGTSSQKNSLEEWLEWGTRFTIKRSDETYLS